MKNISIKKAVPIIAAIVIFLIITFAFLTPVFQGQKLHQNDVTMFKGMSKEIVDFREKTGQEPLWTDAMFGGMPAYQISVKYKSNLVQYIDDVLQLGLPHPANLMFLYFIGFFILMLVMKVDRWLAIIGAVAFALSSYFLIILEAGHNTKAHAIAYMAPVLAGFILAYRGKYLWGAVLTAFAMALEIEANHPQITYYFGFVLLIFGIFELVNAIKDKQLPHFVKASAGLIVAILFGVLTNITPLWATYEYGKESTRGHSELTLKKSDKTTGLDKSYITQWSYGKAETFSLLIPNVKGKGSGYIGNDNKALQDIDPQLRQIVAQQNSYWGDQPVTSGPVYVGAIIMFLFVLGMFILKGRLKWVLFIATVLTVMLSWGKNFPLLTDLFIDYFPAYNKFRAVSMILIVAELCIPLVAILGLNQLIKEEEPLKKYKKGFAWALGITAGLCVIFYITPTTFFSFFSDMENQSFAQYKGTANWAQVSQVLDGLETARVAIFKADALRSLAFILATAIALYFFSIKKINKHILILIVGVLILADLGFVDYRYLQDDKFVDKRKAETPFPLTSADKFILNDKTDYRVLDLSQSTFNSSAASYYHKSIGGYHGAKLQRYQELIEYQINPEMQKLINVLQNNPSDAMKAFENLPVLNMLNTRYTILNPNQKPLVNPFAYGPVWLVDQVKFVDNADEELLGLSNIDTRYEVLVDKRFKDKIADFTTAQAAQGEIHLTSYEPNELKYSFNSNKAEIAVFSEIYYPYGWNAYIDGEKADYIRADYVLRAMEIPAGQHEITFKFEPKVYARGEMITLIASILLFLGFILAVVMEFKKAKK